MESPTTLTANKTPEPTISPGSRMMSAESGLAITGGPTAIRSNNGTLTMFCEPMPASAWPASADLSWMTRKRQPAIGDQWCHAAMLGAQRQIQLSVCADVPSHSG